MPQWKTEQFDPSDLSAGTYNELIIDPFAIYIYGWHIEIMVESIGESLINHQCDDGVDLAATARRLLLDLLNTWILDIPDYFPALPGQTAIEREEWQQTELDIRQARALAAIRQERQYQDAKWGNPFQNRHGLHSWLELIGEEWAEASQAVIDRDDIQAQREIVQIAALCVAALEQHGVYPARVRDDAH